MEDGEPRARSPAAAIAALAAFAAVLPLLSRELAVPGGDNAEYVLLAKSLAGFEGYSSGWYPGPRVPHTQYPPLFPLILSPFAGAAPGSFLPCHLLVACLGAGAVFLLARLFERRGLPPAAAAAAAFAPSLSILWLQTEADVLSEIPFLFLVAATLLLLEPGGEERLPARRVAGAAACAALAFLTRTAGLALLAPVVLALPLDRRTRGRAAWIASGSLAAVALLWFAYGAAAGSEGGYADQLAAGRDGLLARAWLGFRRMYFPNTPAYLFPHPGAAWNGAGRVLWALAAVALAGGLLRRRCLGVTEAFFLATLAMQSAWPFSEPRFALPLAALLAPLAVEGAGAIAARLRGPAAGTALVASALLCLPNAQRYATLVLPRAFRERPAGAPGDHEPARIPATWAWSDEQYRQAALPLASWLHACDALRTGTLPSGPPPPGPVLSTSPRIAALLCGRPAVPAPAATAPGKDPIREGGAALVLVDGFGGPASAALRAARAAAEGDLEPLLALPGGVELLRVRRPGLGSPR